MQISRVSIPLAAMLLAGCAHTAGGNARDVELPPAPVDAPRPARSAAQRSAQ